MNRQILGIAMIVVGAVAALAGCSAEPSVFARTGSSGLEFLVCDAADNPSRIEVLAGPDFYSMDFVWSATGPRIKTPFQVTYGAPPNSWSTNSGPETITASYTRAQIILSWPSNNQVATFDLTDLDSVQWTSDDGDRLTGTCESR